MPRLVPTIQDYIALGLAVESRFLELTKAYLRIKGIPLEVPEDLYNDFIRFREMRVRHEQGDLRNTDDEIKSLKEIAIWSLAVNSAIRNQKPAHMVFREDVGLPNA